MHNILSLVIKNLEAPIIFKVLLNRILYVNHHYYLSLYLPRFNQAIKIREDLSLEIADSKGWEKVLDNIHFYQMKERRAILARYKFFQKGFSGCCFFGKNAQGEVVSMQWLISPKCNSMIKEKMFRLWPILKDNEVIIENLYIFPKFRNAGTFSTVNYLILKIAEEEGCSKCNTFIRKDNIKSLNGFLNLGFKIQKLYTERKFLGHHWRSEQIT